MHIKNSISIFGISFPLYSLMMFLGCMAYLLVSILILEKKEKIDKKTTNKFLFISVPGFIVLGISAIIFNSLFHTIEEGKVVIGGITWLGGVVGMYAAMIYLIHRFIPNAKGNALLYFSYLIPGMVLGHMFGRIGCFFAGCCFGRVTDLPIGVIYPEGSEAAILYPTIYGYSQPVLPTQLFEAAFELILFIVMMLLPKKLFKYNAEIYAIFYSIFRFILEFFRGDDRGATALFISPAQFLGILFMIFGICSILTRKHICFKKIYTKLDTWANGPQEVKPLFNIHINKTNPTTLLYDLKKLYDDGIITKEEYEKKKEEILKRM